MFMHDFRHTETQSGKQDEKRQISRLRDTPKNLSEKYAQMSGGGTFCVYENAKL